MARPQARAAAVATPGESDADPRAAAACGCAGWPAQLDRAAYVCCEGCHCGHLQTSFARAPNALFPGCRCGYLHASTGLAPGARLQLSHRYGRLLTGVRLQRARASAATSSCAADGWVLRRCPLRCCPAELLPGALMLGAWHSMAAEQQQTGGHAPVPAAGAACPSYVLLCMGSQHEIQARSAFCCGLGQHYAPARAGKTLEIRNRAQIHKRQAPKSAKTCLGGSAAVLSGRPVRAEAA